MQLKKDDWVSRYTVTVTTAAKECGKTKGTILNMIESGLPYYILDGQVRVATCQVEQFAIKDRLIELGYELNSLLAFVPDFGNPENWKKYALYKLVDVDCSSVG